MLLRVCYVWNSCLKTKQPLCLSVYIWFQLLLSIISWGKRLQDVSFFTFLDWRELLGAIPKFSRVSRSSAFSKPHGAIIHFSILLSLYNGHIFHCEQIYFMKLTIITKLWYFILSLCWGTLLVEAISEILSFTNSADMFGSDLKWLKITFHNVTQC